MQGIEDAEDSIKAALISFTIHMAAGDAAAATAAMRAVRGRTAWTTMARVAVRSRRADVLALCLDHMEHLAAAQAFRVAKASAERSAAMERRGKGQAGKGGRSSADEGSGVSKGDMAAVGMAAVHLGMETEALEILREGECWHELIDVFQVCVLHATRAVHLDRLVAIYEHRTDLDLVCGVAVWRHAVRQHGGV